MISSKSIRFQLLLSTAVAASLALPAQALAQNLPVAPAPDPTITTNGNTMTVDLQNNARKVYNWNSFDIANGFEVDFTGTLVSGQAVLNRVTLNNVSDIDGVLTAYSWIQVFLINPNGIIFGPNARVDAGSFIASTLNITDADFLGTDGTPGSFQFQNVVPGSGITVNGGAFLTAGAGPLVLLGAFVDVKPGAFLYGGYDPEGEDPQDIALIAGDQVNFIAANNAVLPLDPASPLSISITQGTTVPAGITVGGTLDGKNIYLAMATRQNVTNALLSVTGNVTASSAIQTDHGVLLVAGKSKGPVTVSGAQASGTVSINANGSINAVTGYVAAYANGDVDASNVRGIDIDLHGDGSVTANDLTARDDIRIVAGNAADVSNLIAGATLTTVVTTFTGDGSSAIVTRTFGPTNINGQFGLNLPGHLIEITGAAVSMSGTIKAIDGSVSAFATDGDLTNSGDVSGDNVFLFADNGDVTNSGVISAASSAFLSAFSGNVSNGGTISADNVFLFASGGDVTNSGMISAATEASVSAVSGNISNAGTISAESVHLLANNGNITNSGMISASGAASLSATNGGGISNAGTISANYVHLRAEGGGDITNSGLVSAVSSVDVTATGGDILNGGTIHGGSGYVFLAAGGNVVNSGHVTAGTSVSVFADGSVHNSGTIAAGSNAEISGALGVTNSGLVSVGGDLLVESPQSIVNSGSLEADGSVELDAGVDIDNTGSVSAGGDAVLTAGNDITDSSGTLSGSVSGVDVAMSAGGSITAGTVTARDDIAIRAAGSVTTGNLTSGATIGGAGPVDVAGAADALLPGVDLSGNDVDVQGSTIAANVIRALGPQSDIRLRGPVTASRDDLDFAAGGDITIDGPASGIDVAMQAGGTITAAGISARDDIALRAGDTIDAGTLESGVTVGGAGPVDQAGSADALLNENLAGNDLDVEAGHVSLASATANGAGSDLTVRATTGDLSIDNGAAGGVITLIKEGAAGTLSAGTLVAGTGASLTSSTSISADNVQSASGDINFDAILGVTLGTVLAQAGNVNILANDLDILTSISGSQVSITNREGGNDVTVLGDASAPNAFTLTQDEINRIHTPILTIDSLDQDLLVGNVTFANDVGSSRINLLGTARVDIVGAIDGSGVTRTLQIGGTLAPADPNDPATLASIIRIAPMSSGGGRIILGDGSLDLRGVKIGVGLDDGFLVPLGLIPGGTPASTGVVEADWLGNRNSTLYGIPGGYADPIVISAGTITVTYRDYALFQNTAGHGLPSGVNAGVLNIISSGDTGNGFEMFGTIDRVGGVGAAFLVNPTDVTLGNSRINGCLILTGGGCGGPPGSVIPTDEIRTHPPDPPPGTDGGDLGGQLGGAGSELAQQDLISAGDDKPFDFDSLVGTNNEGLLGIVGVDDCAPDDKRDICRVEEKANDQ